MGVAEPENQAGSPAIDSSGCCVLLAENSPATIRGTHSRAITAICDLKIVIVLLLSVVAVAVVLFSDNAANPRVHANFSGPPPGFTRAPGELACDDCHTNPPQSSGTISLSVPPNYTPGQSYDITVTHNTTDTSRKRWGFELTALDASDQKAGILTPLDGFTQVRNNEGPFPSRQYIEQTTPGSFQSQLFGASWTFRWTAPSQDVGVVTFYVTGNQANDDGNLSGDVVYFTFAASQPAASSPPELRFEQGATDPNQAAALDSLLLTRDPFRVQNMAQWWTPGPNTNTRVIVFAANLGSGSVVVNLVDAQNTSFDVPAEDVRPVANSDFSQITFTLPSGLAVGTCTVRIRVGSRVSNAGSFRVVP
jgi:hypothetical protein